MCGSTLYIAIHQYVCRYSMWAWFGCPLYMLSGVAKLKIDNIRP